MGDWTEQACPGASRLGLTLLTGACWSLWKVAGQTRLQVSHARPNVAFFLLVSPSWLKRIVASDTLPDPLSDRGWATSGEVVPAAPAQPPRVVRGAMQRFMSIGCPTRGIGYWPFRLAAGTRRPGNKRDGSNVAPRDTWNSARANLRITPITAGRPLPPLLAFFARYQTCTGR